MGGVFVLQHSFRLLVHVICFMLLALNFSFVAIAMFTWGMDNAVGGLTVCVVAMFYIAFVVYLIVGPTRIHDRFSNSDQLPLQLLSRWFGKESGHISPLVGAGGLRNGAREEGEMVLLGDGASPSSLSPQGPPGNEVFRIGSGDSDGGSLVQHGSLPEGMLPGSGVADEM